MARDLIIFLHLAAFLLIADASIAKRTEAGIDYFGSISDDSEYPDLDPGFFSEYKEMMQGAPDDGEDTEDVSEERPERPKEIAVTASMAREVVQFGEFSASIDEERRALKYLDVSRKNLKDAEAHERESQRKGQDPMFPPTWLVLQPLWAAVELGGHIPLVMQHAAHICLRCHAILSDPGVSINQTMEFVRAAVSVNHSVAADLQPRLQQLLRNEHARRDDVYAQRVKDELAWLRNLKPDHSGSVANSDRALTSEFSPAARTTNRISNPAIRTSPIPSAEKLDVESVRVEDVGTMETGAFWASRVSVLHLPFPPNFSKRLSDIAVSRYKRFVKEHSDESPSDINNAFFSEQAKADHEQEFPEARAFWRELYQDSQEFKLLKKVAKVACVEHVLRVGRPQRREDLEAMKLIIWAAVYTGGTTHFNHVHEQAVCSGVFYAHVPTDLPTPLIFSDPRGARSNWMHLAYNENGPQDVEPEGPFHNQYALHPRSGDMVLFPSYVPHRVPPHKIGEARVAFAFNLEGPIDAWARLNV